MRVYDIVDEIVDNKRIIVWGLWRNGNASDYESEDCRFDPCQARLFNRKEKKERIKKRKKEGGREKK